MNERCMPTLRVLLQEGTDTLKRAGIEDAAPDAWLLLEYVTGQSRAWYYAHSMEAAEEETVQSYRTLCRKRAEHIPLQHLTHRAYFMEYEFYVDENVLIPRQDTETLVEIAREILKEKTDPAILDMCTGSGCILISLLANKKDSSGVGADISSEALEVARRNAVSIGVQDRIRLTVSDLFSGTFFQEKDGKEPEKYDMLISNPPYIPTGEINGLMEEVRLHDPVRALDGREDGLYFYRMITARAQSYLKPEGWLLYEIGCDQGEDVETMMKQAGFESVKIRQDLAGLDRVVMGQVPQRNFGHQEDNHV